MGSIDGGGRISCLRVSLGAVFCKWASIFLMTTGLRITAKRRTLPPQSSHFVKSILNVCLASSAQDFLETADGFNLPFSSRAFGFGISTTYGRIFEFGARTPKYRIKCPRGGGTAAANFSISSTPDSWISTVPSLPRQLGRHARLLHFIAHCTIFSHIQPFVRQGWSRNVTDQSS